MLSELYIEHDLEIQVRIFALGVPRSAEFDLSTYPMGGRASSRAGFNSATNPPDPTDCRGLSVSVGIADREDAIPPGYFSSPAAR